ncbi:MAG TPA: cytochrome c peroxidase [Bryobacteraceae bacterium]|nr:cytochrome c peroxidase [Bryobacteraceae bacterium]
MFLSKVVAGGALPAIFFLSCVGAAQPAKPAKSLRPREPLGLVPVVWPRDNPYTPEKAALGRLLYFDPRLSADGTVSCATCHNPKYAFTDGAAVSTGIRGQKGNRSAPTVINRAYSLAQFWDGRAPTLEEQAKGPMANPIEMGSTHIGIVENLKKIKGYRTLFAAAFDTDEITIDRAAQAITTFERTIMSGNSPYDRYRAGQKTALTASQVRGHDVFLNKAKCDACHEGVNFTSNMYANLGIGADKPDPDVGRYAVTHDPKDWGAFKTPTLREIARTAPYMHDGSLKTLEEVVEYYDKGGMPNRNLDQRIKPLHLTDQNKKDLVAFLNALSGEGWQKITAPEKFPE